MLAGAVFAQKVGIPKYTNKLCHDDTTSKFAQGLIPDTLNGGCKCADPLAQWASGPFNGRTFTEDGANKY